MVTNFFHFIFAEFRNICQSTTQFGFPFIINKLSAAYPIDIEIGEKSIKFVTNRCHNIKKPIYFEREQVVQFTRVGQMLKLFEVDWNKLISNVNIC